MYNNEDCKGLERIVKYPESNFCYINENQKVNV